ncbi:hypothetical protein GSI_08632 [Ganoderma sinense ZZ0214-1]|uniref:Uncharacterized protein n=1 Tax=Ganoderma sinense ZZ0214-1 TaxID=1077348 RepID=A0A2G8S4A0_9APHY|nr:hypothetical protein GSI_08632 [Ganoderma sinense ZZ0214-1]
MQLSPRLLVLCGLVAFASAQNPLVINTPVDVVQCQVTILTWEGGVAPFSLKTLVTYAIRSIRTEDQETIFTASNLQGTSFGWDASVPAGTVVGFDVKDATGALAQSAFVAIQSSSDNTCF